MPRASLSVQKIARSGLEPSYTAAEVDGNSFANPGLEQRILHVKNGATAVVVTCKTPRQVDGLDVAELAVTVPAGEERMIGPFPTKTFTQGDGTVHVDYDDVSNVTVAVLGI